MNVVARQYKPVPTAGGGSPPAVAKRPSSSSNNQQAALKKSSSFTAAAPAASGFDYEAEIRRLAASSAAVPQYVAQPASPVLTAGGVFDGRVAPRLEDLSPSRFRWVQPVSEETLPPKDKPARNLTSASKARNQMYRPVEQPKPTIDTEAEAWRRLTPAQRAARILGKA